jgi:ribonuclease HII
MKSNLWAHDVDYAQALGDKMLVGVDEAGRGPLAGHVVAACVVFDLNGEPLAGLNDSKKLTEARREALYPEIMARASGFGIGFASPQEIDRINILQATFLAMARALAALRGHEPQAGLVAKALPESLRGRLHLCVDGNKTIPGAAFSQQALVKGDGLSASIAAASILAKVTRDRQLLDLDALYPQYGFAQHKGYPTEAHREAVREHGMCPAHRKSFCRDLAQAVDLFAG